MADDETRENEILLDDSWVFESLRATNHQSVSGTAKDNIDPEFLNRIKDLRFIKSLELQLELPKRIGPYEFLELLGVGGMGAVYRVRHNLLNKEFALKILKQDRVLDPESVLRFKKEIEALGRLEHSGIVSARNADEHVGILYLVMDLVDGRSLCGIRI
ncbi:MAG: hypothetical protein R3C03_17650 [Pirellulaceae bacterium]